MPEFHLAFGVVTGLDRRNEHAGDSIKNKTGKLYRARRRHARKNDEDILTYASPSLPYSIGAFT